MLKMTGHLIALYTSSDFKKEDGTIVPGKTKLQLLTKVTLKNGTTKNELIDISIPLEKLVKYKGKENTDVEVDVAIIGKCNFYGI
ncbi:MAG: hypothetical protein KA253_01980 [Campylobacteraceae bacterium]|nr:hypothetical protein [Campylobacteraceae bacterium]